MGFINSFSSNFYSWFIKIYFFRYNEKSDGSDALVDLCTKFLPKDVNLDTEGPYKIKPNFDVEMNLIGYYDTSFGLKNYKIFIFHYLLNKLKYESNKQYICLTR